MKNWSANENSNSRKDFEKIAQIIVGEEFDVVALQEILSAGKGVKNLLEQGIKYGLYDWDFCWGLPFESSDLDKIAESKDNRGEGYAYLWNKKRFKLLEFLELGKSKVFEPRIISNNDVRGINPLSFIRAPYYIRLEPLYGGFFELRLINIHIYWGGTSGIDKRREEFATLTQRIYPAISQRRYGDFRAAYTIAMGDYNLNIYNPNIQTKDNCYLVEMYSYNDGKKDIHILTRQDQLTTLKREGDGLANNFDHFTYSPELSGFVNVSFEAVDAVRKYCNGDFAYYNSHISDHLPIAATVEI